MSKIYSEPIGQTCPDINNALKILKSMRDEADAADINLRCEFNRIESYFEDLRTSNGKLRDWGGELVERLQSVEGELDTCEEKLSDATREIEYLNGLISDKEDEIKSLEARLDKADEALSLAQELIETLNTPA